MVARSEFVTCASCGARIRADRVQCLRCGEPLRPSQETPAAPATTWLAFINGPGSIVGILVSLGALIVLALWVTRPEPIDDVARPAAGQPAPHSAAAPLATADASALATRTAADPLDLVTALDANRAGSAAFSQGDLAGARARFELALEKQPDSAEALNNLGLVLERLGRLDEAAGRFSQAADLLPAKWAYRFNYAHALGALGQWDRAILEYRRAAELFPDDYATQYNLAMALHKKGDDTAAIPEFEKAVALAPSEPSFHVSLGISLEAVGRTADAQREYRTYLEMAPSAPDADKLKAHLEELAQAGQSPPGVKPPAEP